MTTLDEQNADPEKVESQADKPIDLIPKAALEFKPRVGDIPDLHIDLGNGVIVGRSESFHSRYSTSGLGILGAVSETTDDVLTSVLGMPVKLDLMSPHVLFVAGKRGSGKSYTLGIIAEELALAMERQEIEVAVVMIDTVDVFRQMVEPNVDQADLLKKWGLESRNFPINVYIPRRTYAGLPDDVKKKARLFPLAISPRELTGSDWGYVLEKGGQLSTAMDNLISEILDSVRRGYALDSGERVPLKRDFSIAEMIKCVDTNPAIIDLYQSSTRTAMIQRLKRANRLGVFHPGGTSAQDLAVGGQVTIIDVAPLGSDAESVLAILTNMLSRQVLTYRMAWTDEGTSAREELPPTWLIIDEAHTLVPKTGSTPAKEAIIGYAKLGRRFGCSLVLCTQQPSSVSDDAISQADIIISHSLSHDTDIRALQQRAPAVMPDQFRDKVFISSLPRGVALVFDQTTANKRGFIMQVRPRLSQHGGADRLSGLFEAARLMSPEEIELVPSEIETDEETVLEEEEPVTELPVVPRPPVKLSKDDWQLLDKWMKDYVEKMFEQKMQDFAITDEPAPRTDETPPVVKETKSDTLPEIEVSERDSIDISNILIRNFPTLSDQLLETALRRKVLYSRASHRFLFESDPAHRESVSIQSDTAEPNRLLEKVLDVLLAAGMRHVETTDEEGFSFVFLRKDGMKASVSIATCFSQISIPIVLVGEKNREIVSLAEKIRQA